MSLFSLFSHYVRGKKKKKPLRLCVSVCVSALCMCMCVCVWSKNIAVKVFGEGFVGVA